MGIRVFEFFCRFRIFLPDKSKLSDDSQNLIPAKVSQTSDFAKFYTRDFLIIQVVVGVWK